MAARLPEDFAGDWIDGFNEHDLERVLAHYSPDVELVSPFYLRFTGGRSDSVRGIGELRAYFEAAFARYPELRFTLLEVAAGARSLCLRYHTNIGDRIAMEYFEGPPSGAATRVVCHYLDERGQ